MQFRCSVLSDSLRPHGLHQASLSITNSRSVLKLMSIEWVMPSNHLILGRPLLLLLSIFPRVFSNESALRIRWPKYWSFSFNISPSNEHSGLVSFRMDWLDLLAVQGTLKSPHGHHLSLSLDSQDHGVMLVMSDHCGPATLPRLPHHSHLATGFPYRWGI